MDVKISHPPLPPHPLDRLHKPKKVPDMFKRYLMYPQDTTTLLTKCIDPKHREEFEAVCIMFGFKVSKEAYYSHAVITAEEYPHHRLALTMGPGSDVWVLQLLTLNYILELRDERQKDNT